MESINPAELQVRKDRMLDYAFRVLMAVVGSMCLGYQYGWRTGFGVGLITVSLIRVSKWEKFR